MARKKKKNRLIPLVLLLVVCAGLAGLWWFLDSKDYNAPPKTESTVTAIHSESSDALTSVTFVDKDGIELSFTKEEGCWYITDDKEFPVNNTKVNEMFTPLARLLSTRVLEEDNGEFGFDDPQTVLTLTFTGENGTTQYKYTVGDVNSFNGGTYLRDDLNGKYYICSTNPAEKFDIVKKDLFQVDAFAADVGSTDVKKITLFDADGSTKVIEDNDGVDLFMAEAFEEMDLIDWVAYGIDAETMASEYGIVKDPEKNNVLVDYKTTVTVKDENGESSAMRVDATYNVWFGNTLEDGSVYYTQTGSEIVYKLSAEKYGKVMKFMNYTPAETTAEETTAEDTTAQ